MENTLLVMVHPEDGLVDLRPLVKRLNDYMEDNSLINLEIELLEIASMLKDIDEDAFLGDTKMQKIKLLKSIVALLKICRNAD